MPWPLPQPGEIADRLAGSYEREVARALGVPVEEVDARSPDSLLAVLARVQAAAQFDLHLHQRAIADELMPDSATDWLPRHAAVWGVERLGARAAVGTAAFSGPPGLALPSGVELYAPSAEGLWATTEAAVLPAAATVAVPLVSRNPGAVGNLPAGTTLGLVSPIPGLASQTAVVGPGGVAGGAEEEHEEAWRARLLERIREEGEGGSRRDYERWAREAGAAQWNVVPGWVGAGTVGLVVAMPGPRAPTSAELAAVAAHVEGRRPVTAEVVVVAAVPLPVPVALVVSPDTVAVRLAAEAAVAAFFAAEAAIGGTIHPSRLSEAVSAVAGEYSHRLLAPAAAVVAPRDRVPVLAGAVSFS